MLSTLVLELDRDPRMGRNEEAYTEDPYLYLAYCGVHRQRSTQGDNIAAADKVVAVLTDFPTQRRPASGLERGPSNCRSALCVKTFCLPGLRQSPRPGH